MTAFLVDAALIRRAAEGEGDALESIVAFDKLRARTGFELIPFVAEEDMQQLFNRPPRGLQAFFRLLQHLEVHGQLQPEEAEPQAAPTDVGANWRRALLDALVGPADWRRPYVVYPHWRRNMWPQTDELTIALPKGGSERRVLVQLERFAEHKLAEPDLDPWDLRSMHPARGGQYECRLPKPPEVERTPFSQIAARIDAARKAGWHRGNSYYFIPPRGWCCPAIARDTWRRPAAFAHYRHENGHEGPKDVNGLVWSWDDMHRHWDVQTNPYMRVSHTGEFLSLGDHW